MSSNSPKSPRIRVYVPPSFEGVSTVAMLEEIILDWSMVEIKYVSHLDFRDHRQFKDAEIVIVIGLAYAGYALPDDFHINYDVPFVDFLHFANYGEPIPGAHVISSVSEDTDPSKELYEFLYNKPESTILSKHVRLTAKAQQLVEAVNAYRTWTWENNGTTRMLLALYYASYKRLPHLLSNVSIEGAVRTNAAVIKGQLEKMEDYIERKQAMVKSYTINIGEQQCILKVVFAEEYINELANDLLNNESANLPVIVCVGRSTKSNDMFSIRTRDVNAAQVAHYINGGQGKENVANVFTTISYAELMGNGIATALSRVTV